MRSASSSEAVAAQAVRPRTAAAAPSRTARPTARRSPWCWSRCRPGARTGGRLSRTRRGVRGRRHARPTAARTSSRTGRGCGGRARRRSRSRGRPPRPRAAFRCAPCAPRRAAPARGVGVAAQRRVDLGQVALHPVEQRVEADRGVAGDVGAERTEAAGRIEARLAHRAIALVEERRQLVGVGRVVARPRRRGGRGTRRARDRSGRRPAASRSPATTSGAGPSPWSK